MAHSIERAARCFSGRRRVPTLLRALGLPALPAFVPVAGPLPHAFQVGAPQGAAVFLIEVERLDGNAISRVTRALRGSDATRLDLYLLAEHGYRRFALAAFDLRGELRHLRVERDTLHAAEAEVLCELVAAPGEVGVQLAVRWSAALDRRRLGDRFFRELRAHREAITGGWTGIPERASAERAQLALLLLSRLMFLSFLERAGHLDGDRAYLRRLVRDHAARRTRRSLLRGPIDALFFDALNRRPDRRTPAGRALGALPYLNGGLFERHPLERRHPQLDLPDPLLASVIDTLLARYRFTAGDRGLAPGSELGIDPEVLGHVFESLMAPEARRARGTFFTPAATVDALLDDAFAALLAPTRAVDRTALRDRVAGLTVLDPACGSGAFLLGALGRLARLRAELEARPAGELRRDVVARALHGVDVDEDAALLCSLRLWLALATGAAEPPPPLPNLDRRIRQGDALLAPLDLGAAGDAEPPWRSAAADPAVRQALRSLGPLGAAYVGADPEEKRTLVPALHAAERTLARVWLGARLARLRHRAAELRGLAADRDLFGAAPASAARAAAALATVDGELTVVRRAAAALEESGALPFFSFGVHFADEARRGFDLVIGNPPWVRARRWRGAHGAGARESFTVCRTRWRRGAALGGGGAAAGAQIDLSALFIERGLRLLAPAGVLAMLVPSKLLRSLHGAGVRALVTTGAVPVSIVDHGLDQRAIFRADAFAAALVVRAVVEPAPDAAVAVTLTHPRSPRLRFSMPARELSLDPADPASPWLLAPPEVQAALRRMLRAGPPLGDTHRVRRGVMTGANAVLIARALEPKLGDLAHMRAEGFEHGGRRFEALVEGSAFAPLVRGSGVRAWRYEVGGHVVWLRDAAARPTAPPPRLERYLQRHAAARTTRGRGARIGTVGRVSPDTLRPKVAWQDIAETIQAVALPAVVTGPLGTTTPLVPLNTVYFVPVDHADDALYLSALLNSCVVRTFARVLAERAKDARFRFFGWTIGSVPLPPIQPRQRGALLAIARRAHEARGITPEDAAALDDLVGDSYALPADDRRALASFDAWLRGDAG